MISVAVFVNSITKDRSLGIIVEASNGGANGPPFIRFVIPESKAFACHVGKRYTVTIDEA